MASLKKVVEKLVKGSLIVKTKASFDKLFRRRKV
jgi:hypothetical protein